MKKILILAMAAFGLMACSNEPEEPERCPGGVEFTNFYGDFMGCIYPPEPDSIK